MKNDGLTLIEVLVAMAIIAVAFMALAYTQISNLRVTRDSKLASISTQVANETMERAVKWLLDQKDEFGTPTFTCGENCTGSYSGIEVDGAEYTGAYTIVVDGDTGLAEITVTVNEPKAIEMSQYVSCMDVVPPPSFDDPSPCPELIVEE